jgi:hypothetical protein
MAREAMLDERSVQRAVTLSFERRSVMVRRRNRRRLAALARRLGLLGAGRRAPARRLL